ncbi:MAG: TIGR03084 family protein [Acidimicrobiales bacterium MED-G01]|nr:MAG: TIGR03084 family protein [Acidimicrobiales bacterium MED-G01]
MNVDQICDDIAAETEALSVVVGDLTEDQWRAPTVAEGWDTHETILHLAAADWACHLAVTNSEAFVATRAQLSDAKISLSNLVGAEVLAMQGHELWEWFLNFRAEMINALRKTDPKARITWLGPDIGARSLATSRLLETWTHSLDLADSFGLQYPRTDRLRHIAHIGVVTREFSYVNRGLAPPSQPVRVELTSPSGERWDWGPDGATNTVTASAYEFCKVITRRTPLVDSTVETQGSLATEWMEIAQPWIEPPRISDQA